MTRVLHADANVAAQIPPAGIAADRLLINDLRSRHRHISRVRRGAHDDRHQGGEEVSYADHLLRPFSAATSCGQASLNEAKGVRKFLNAP
jgi:hypothetical protein